MTFFDSRSTSADASETLASGAAKAGSASQVRETLSETRICWKIELRSVEMKSLFGSGA